MNNDVCSTDSSVEDVVTDEDFAREITPTTEEQIVIKLREMNLAIEPRLKNRMRQWFYDRKIVLHSLFGRIYRDVPGIEWSDIVGSINTLNELFKDLLIIKAQNEQDGVKFIMVDGRYTYEPDQALCVPANEIAGIMKEMLKWFKDRGLRVRLVKMPEFSYYVYMGLKDDENMNGNDIVVIK